MPEYCWERAAWFAIHIMASDSVTSGLQPKLLSIDLNLPMEITKKQLEMVWDVIHKECEKLGITVITGHTTRYENCHYPMVGGANMFGIGGLDEYVTPWFCNAGDKIIVTKGPAIDATGIFTAMFLGIIEKEFGPEFSRKAQEIFYKMSVVDDALMTVSVGFHDNGVTAMHDATEYGLWGSLYELAKSANLGARIEKEKIIMEECIFEVCQFFGIDPYAFISEGTLIIACKAPQAEAVVQALACKGIKSSVV